MNRRICLLLVSILVLASCVKREDFSVVSLDKVDIVSMSKVDLTLTVKNASRRNLMLKDGRMTITKDGFELGQIMIREDVTIPKRFQGEVVMPLRIKLTDMFGFIALFRNLDTRLMNGVTATGSIYIKAGALKKEFKFKDMPLSKILANFGIKPEDLKLQI